jgi:hypothetical protein
MPLSFDPNARAEFWLACDRDLAAHERPVFLVRFLTQRQLDDYSRLMAESGAAGDDATSLRLAWQAIELGVVGWRNFRGPDGQELEFGAESIGRVLTVREFWELALNYPAAVRLVGDDLKNSLGPSKLDLGGCAPTAPAAAT